MLAAERGAAANTLDAYRRDLERFLRAPRRAWRRDRDARKPRRSAAISAELSGRGFSAASVARRLSAIRQLYRFLYAEGNRKDDPAAAIEGPKRGRPLPKVLSVGQVDQLLGAAREGMRCDASGRRAAARRAAQLPARSAVRDRPARLRAGRAAGLGGAARRAHADRARQGQQGAPRAAERGRRSGRCASIWRCARKPRSRRRARSRPRNGCFRRSARAAT